MQINVGPTACRHARHKPRLNLNTLAWELFPVRHSNRRRLPGYLHYTCILHLPRVTLFHDSAALDVADLCARQEGAGARVFDPTCAVVAHATTSPVRRLYRQECAPGLADRVCAAVSNVHHSWYVLTFALVHTQPLLTIRGSIAFPNSSRLPLCGYH